MGMITVLPLDREEEAMPPNSHDARLAPLSQRQYGTFSRPQVLRRDFTDAMIQHRLAGGLWISLHPGVYADAAVPSSDEQVALAACLACGDGAVASHLSAARLYGVELSPPALPDVTNAVGAHPRSDAIDIHRAKYLGRLDVGRIRGIPVTSGMRTASDLARELDERPLEIVLDTLWRQGLLHPERLLAYLAGPHQRSRKGTGVLRALARERVGQRPPGSDLETRYIQILKDYGVPLPARQQPVMTRHRRRFIDLAYPEHRVAIELDGFERHGRDRSVFDDDHVRRNDLDELQFRIREFTNTHIEHDPCYVALTTAEAIGLEPASWRRRP
jgi:very-short-patch-repair endonuclease